MSASDPEATSDYSKSERARTALRRPSAGAAGPFGIPLAGLALAGAALCVVATFSPVIRIEVLTVQKASFSGYDRHGVALLLIGIFAVPMVLGALRGALPAMAALAALGVTTLLIAILGDLPHLNDTGPIGDLFENARARAGAGYYLETLGGVLLLLAGVAFLAVGRTTRPSVE